MGRRVQGTGGAGRSGGAGAIDVADPVAAGESPLRLLGEHPPAPGHPSRRAVRATRSTARSSARRRRLIRWAVAGGVVLAGLAACAGWLAHRGRQAQAAVAALQRDGAQLQQQLSAYDLTTAAATLGRVRADSARAQVLTSDPVWRAASHIPFAGRRLRAAAVSAQAVADITRAAQPLESALPALDPAGAGRFDVQAVTTIGQALPAVSSAITSGAVAVGEIDASRLDGDEAAAVRRLQDGLNSARQPLARAVPLFRLMPGMLGADRSKTWMVLLQQDAEARGTGGLIGAYAVLRTQQGQLRLVTARSRQTIDRGPKVPSATLPASLRDLWGTDLTEWAGLNASPNFPWTGHLVAAGWKARGLPALDYVAAIDPYTVAAMLSATGPVTVRGTEVSDRTAVRFLSRDVYARWPDPRTVDEVVAELVRTTFARFAAGRLDVARLIQAFKEPAQQRRLLLWAAEPQEQSQISGYPVAGVLPREPGPFAMAVVNNGGGNKLDAYLKVHTDYQPGSCIRGQRLGSITVTLNNTAPRTGLPAYVTQRNDLRELGLPARHVAGSNRVILDVYGPVAGKAAATSLDGETITPISGVDSNHSVWRMYVPIDPGQRRTVRVAVLAPAVPGEVTTTAPVITQPMALPATATAEPVTACRT